MYSWAKVTTKCVRGPWGNRLRCLSAAHVPVTINACWTTMAFPSAWHSLVLSLPSAAVTGVLKAVISTLCSIATVPSPLLYCSQFSQACGCLSLEVDSPVICFSCLPSCCSAPTFLLHRDISLSITAFNNAVFHTAPHFFFFFFFPGCDDLLSSDQKKTKPTGIHSCKAQKCLLSYKM